MENLIFCFRDLLTFNDPILSCSLKLVLDIFNLHHVCNIISMHDLIMQKCAKLQYVCILHFIYFFKEMCLDI